MSDFWERQLGGRPAAPQAQPQYRPPSTPSRRAWWQDEPEPQPQQAQVTGTPMSPAQATNYGALQQQMPYGGPTQGAGMPEDQFMRQLSRVPADQLNQEQMEAIADWELRTKDKYNAVCPQCGSGNFVFAGTRNAHGVFSTDKCFDCNYSARGPLPAIGGGSGGKSGAATRQIDTGGAVKSMYMKVGNGRQIPASYMPRL